MKIILCDSRDHLFADVSSWEAANVAAKAIFKRQYWSDLYYHVVFEDNTHVSGSIDLEPASFHRDHQNQLFTWHLRTFWTNISKSKPLPHLDQEAIDWGKSLLNKLPI